jgi:hypothetical protein
VDEVVASLGEVHAVYILDDYAQGRDSGLIDALIVGRIDRGRLDRLRSIVEAKVERTVRVLDVTPEDFNAHEAVFLGRPHWRVL